MLARNLRLETDVGRPRPRSMSETPGSLSALTLQLGLVGSKRCVPDLFDLSALVLFWQSVLSAKLETAMWALADEVDCCVLALPLGPCSVLASLLGTTSQPQDEVKSGLLLNVVVRQRSAILELLSCKDESLLVRWDALLVLNLGLDIVDSVARLDLKSDGLASKSLDEDLHTTAETQDKVEGRFLLNVVVGESATVFKLLSSKDETLLIRGDAFLVLDLGLDVVNGIAGLDLEGDGFAGESLDKDLHLRGLEWR